jgi:hypothetical protein
MTDKNNKDFEKIQKELNNRIKGFGMDGLQERFKEASDKLNVLMSNLNSDIAKIKNPKMSRDTNYNGNHITINLIEDARVFIKFSTLEDAGKFYNDFENLFERLVNLEKENKKIKSNWWVKLMRIK